MRIAGAFGIALLGVFTSSRKLIQAQPVYPLPTEKPPAEFEHPPFATEAEPSIATTSTPLGARGTPETPGRFATIRESIVEALRSVAEFDDNKEIAQKVRRRLELTHSGLNCHFSVLVWERPVVPDLATLGKTFGVATSNKVCNVMNGLPADECAETGGSLGFVGKSRLANEPLYGLLVFTPTSFSYEGEAAKQLLEKAQLIVADCRELLLKHWEVFASRGGIDLSTFAECTQIGIAKVKIPGLANHVTFIGPDRSLGTTAPSGTMIAVFQIGLIQPELDRKELFQSYLFPMPQ